VREDWLDIIETALGLETALVDSGKELAMELILDRRNRDLDMFRRLSGMGVSNERTSQLRRIIRTEEETLDRWSK
jgi:hypothetical protein